MTSRKWVGVYLTFGTLFCVGASCTSGGPPPPRQPAAVSSSSAKPPVAAASARKRTPPRPAPPLVTTPMSDAPNEAALAEARLEPASCEEDKKATKERAEALLREMNEAVDARYRSWHELQPRCWEGYKQQNHVRRYRSAPKASAAWGIGAGYGSGAIAPSGAGRTVVSENSAGVAGKKAGKARSASGTNNQVAGVDEADIVKNDGSYVYVAMNGSLRILEALEPRTLSVTRLDGNVREMFVSGDRAVLYVAKGGNLARRCTYGYDCRFAGDGSSTEVVVFDVSDRTSPRETRRIGLSGSLMAARRIGNAIHTVVADNDLPPPHYQTWPSDLPMCGVKQATVLERLKKLRADNAARIRAEVRTKRPTITEKGQQREICDILRTPIADGESFTSVVSFDVTNDAQPAVTATLQSRPGAVYASGNALYLSVVHGRPAARGRWYSFYSSVDEVSDIHKFSIGEDPKRTRYVGSGVVPGHVLNQFAMDEWYGYLRVATSRGRVPDPSVESVVSILAPTPNGSLVRVGAVEGLAPGEDIRSVRFDGDRGYVVTFKKTDPLFVLDLYQPNKPEVLGELKIPGFSTYMHRIDPDHLLSIGFDADDQGDFAYFDGVILQLFDVSKPTDPRLLHKEKIGTRGSSSEAATNHLAFNYFDEKGLLAFPMTICEGGGNGRNGNELTFAGLLVYTVSVEGGFKRLGGVDHGTQGSRCNTWWSSASSAVKRSIFLDDLVYSIATDRLKVQRLGHFGQDIADISLLP